MFLKACLTAALLAVHILAKEELDPCDLTDTGPIIGPVPICKPRRAYCKMLWDSYNPTTNPWGVFRLYQKNPFEPIQIKGYMK